MSEFPKGPTENGAEAHGMEVAQMDERSVDQTLRMIARMSAPDGMEERVKAGLRRAVKPGRVLRWPADGRGDGLPGYGGWMRSGWMRGAAAAAIAVVVVGGGWGIYSRVEPAQSARTGALQQAPPGGAAQAGAFGEAGAMRRPQTVIGPAVPGHKSPGPEAMKPAETKLEKTGIHSQVSQARPGAPSVTHLPAPTQ